MEASCSNRNIVTIYLQVLFFFKSFYYGIVIIILYGIQDYKLFLYLFDFTSFLTQKGSESIFNSFLKDNASFNESFLCSWRRDVLFSLFIKVL